MISHAVLLIGKRLSKHQDSVVGVVRDWLFLDTKSETGWEYTCTHMGGRDNYASNCAYCHFCLRLLDCCWVSRVVCATPITTDTAGCFWSRSCLHLNCMLDHHAMLCCCILLPLRAIRYSFLHHLRCLVLGALLYAPVLNKDLCCQSPEGWTSFSMMGGREVEF